jgi:hypothetical protein
MNQYLSLFFALSILLMFTGCTTHEPVRHLSEEAYLVKIDKTTKEEVSDILGAPEFFTTGENNQEKWYYYQQETSFMRDFPIIGDSFSLGSAEYHFLLVEFSENAVSNCTFRVLSNEEFQEIILAAF